VVGEFDLGPRDFEALQDRGISVREAQRQLALLRNPPPPRKLVRPCTLGDGIVRIPEADQARLVALHDEAAAKGQVGKFVPASGAATRMFKDLLVHRGSHDPIEKIEQRAASGDAEAKALLTFLERMHEFAFVEDLWEELERRGAGDRSRARARHPSILEALLHEEGLGYAGRPKALIPFHRYESGSRTPVEEHLVEASALVRDAAGVCRVWFTVSPEERPRFEALLTEVVPGLERERSVHFELRLSEQRKSTDTLAIDGRGRPFRDASGSLVLRPGGHGALLENLAEVDVPFVQIKNIDNIAHHPLRRPGIHWKKVMTGLAVVLHGAAVRDGLARPIRVCGVVRNQGEPGGGPFWVQGRDGEITQQIVESAEIDSKNEAQRAVFTSGTHFNPVDMVCALTSENGQRFELGRFVDPDAVIVAGKSFEGRDLVALERPGLWNGSMALWHTAFVEIPGEAFTPVKAVLDLLRPEHLR